MFLDVDGTLIDIAPNPFQVIVPPDLPELLERLARLLDGAVALVSGRALSDLDRLFGPLRVTLAGQHGAEIRRPGKAAETLGTPDGALQRLLPAIQSFVATRPGLLIENKGHTIAVHCRQAPQYESELNQFLADLVAADRGRLNILAGHRVFELKPPDFSKGTVIRHLLRFPPFAGRVPVFLGDDTTDEDGFMAVDSEHGHSIRVGMTGSTAASSRIADPASVLAYLAEAAAQLSALSPERTHAVP
jgi:trehalose 6-phosphate phosphatase